MSSGEGAPFNTSVEIILSFTSYNGLKDYQGFLRCSQGIKYAGAFQHRLINSRACKSVK